jgi:hypothetical protein
MADYFPRARLLIYPYRRPDASRWHTWLVHYFLFRFVSYPLRLHLGAKWVFFNYWINTVVCKILWFLEAIWCLDTTNSVVSKALWACSAGCFLAYKLAVTDLL